MHHEAPESEAARQLVRRMVARGMPCVPGRAGGLFFRDQVEAWLRAQAAAAAAVREASPATPAKNGRMTSRRRGSPAPATPILERVRQLREGNRRSSS